MLNNELDGFVVYKPQLRHQPGIFLTIGKSGIKLSTETLKAINSEWILLFFDYNKQRLMIQPSKKGAVNTLKLSIQSRHSPANTLMQKSVMQDVRDLAGIKEESSRWVVYGHKCNYATSPSIIFPLKDIKEADK